ncbi:YihY family inner membrane protein [Arenicella xantha]|uniref:UPF0761 membrane protein DFR28_102977 n=1 Tax=Arenicella xantha TaxID=644221 RepID=A0A395JP31_9GAMM|nr:YihY family inner membrane protein [Arenicella xantha]RBP51547.1 tRNA-processing RNAse BN [Arenicella xantha]
MTDYWLKNTLIQLWEVPLAVVRRFGTDRLLRHAAALAFSSLLALAPMAAIALSLFSLFSGFEQLGTSFQDFIYQFLLPTAGNDLQVYFANFAGQAGKLTLFGLVFFLLTALVLLASIEQSFNDIWRVKQGRSVTSRLTVYWAMISLGPFLMGGSLTLSTYLLSFSMSAGENIHSIGLTLLPFGLETLAFLMLYLIMPNVRVSFVHALTGALVASCLFEITKSLFTSYISNYSNYDVVYGALSTLPILLIWVYLSWVVALVGAELVAVLQERHLLELEVSDMFGGHDEPPKPE